MTTISAVAGPSPATAYLEQLTSRTRGITRGHLQNRHVAFVGVGASLNLIKGCARTGVSRISLFDFDTVEVANLGRTAYEMRDVGRPKVEAARDHLLQVNPFCEVRAHHGDFMAIEDDELAALLEDVNVLVMGTDAQQVQLRGNRIGRELGKSMVFPGFYRRADGGEIVVVTPETPCYRCQVLSRFEAREQDPSGNADLRAEAGLIFDCDHLDSIVGKIVVALLLKDDVEEFGEFCRHLATHSLIFSKHHPSFLLEGVDLFGDFYGQSPLAYAYQTLWLDPRSWRDPGCPICGGEH